jgi:5-methylcytosine-specific restriction endonuclease McrA
VGRLPTRQEYRALLAEAADDLTDSDLMDGLLDDAARIIDQLATGRPGQKDPKLTRRARLSRAHSPKRRTRPGALVRESEFQAMRQLVFERAGQRCERCGRHRREVGVLHAHHRQLLSRSGEDRPANLASLCPECHEWCHRNVKTATGLGYIVPSRSDPARRAMQLPDGRWTLLNDQGGYELVA